MSCVDDPTPSVCREFFPMGLPWVLFYGRLHCLVNDQIGLYVGEYLAWMYDLFLTHRVNRRREKRKKKEQPSLFFNEGYKCPLIIFYFLFIWLSGTDLRDGLYAQGSIRSRVRWDTLAIASPVSCLMWIPPLLLIMMMMMIKTSCIPMENRKRNRSSCVDIVVKSRVLKHLFLVLRPCLDLDFWPI